MVFASPSARRKLGVRRHLLGVIASLSLVGVAGLPSLAQALEVKPYTQQAFDELLKANKPVAVHFRTSWCSVCKAQQVLLNQMQTKNEVGYDLTVLAVDYDQDKAARERHKVKERSTLIAYGGGVEKARLQGDADEKKIKAVLKAALSK